ncbi:MAG: stage V sporulation protein AC [Bacillota bacterium]|nr:stage V sporulation protein AC [Bacillota bacterium]
MNVTKKQYGEMTKKTSPNSTIFKNCIKAFLVGGLICLIGQGLTNLYMYWGVSADNSKLLCTITLVFLGAFLTAIHVYDNIAKHAGAGTIVPITGFANSIVAPAIEFKSEGFITGLGVKMFVIAGPVLVFGITASAIYGLILYLIQVMHH